MKRLVIIFFLVLSATFTYGRNNEALKFLGIPVDGTKEQFITKLRSKGFTYNSYTEYCHGQFNGENVRVYVHVNHNIVDRIYVEFPITTEKEIKNRYNRLLRQFKENHKYTDLSFNEEIPEKEDISYEIIVKEKNYQACFSYFDPNRDQASFIDESFEILVNALSETNKDNISEDYLKELKQYIKTTLSLPENEQQKLTEYMCTSIKDNAGQLTEEDMRKQLLFVFTYFNGLKTLADGEVWFTIHQENYNRYHIGLYYDNLHNRPHGEDL